MQSVGEGAWKLGIALTYKAMANYSGLSFDCDPTVPDTACGSKCSLDDRCPIHNYDCYGESRHGEDAGFDENEGLCDCSVFYGCNGASCDENNSAMTAWWIATGLVVVSVGIVTFLKAARLLYLMMRAGKLGRGATSQCLVYSVIGEFFGCIYWFEIMLRRPLT